MKYFMTPQKHGLGWLPDEPDSRDYVFPAAELAPAVAALPEKVDLRAHCPPVYDQGQLGSCTANAVAGAFDFDRHKEGKPFLTPSRLFVYWNERDLQHSIDSDSGATIRNGVKVLASDGVPPETDWPYDIAEFTVKPPAKAYKDAAKNQALVYQRIQRPTANLVSDMLRCLAAGYPFVSGVTIYQSFETNTTASTGIIPMPSEGESVLGGHAIMIVGYDQSKDWFICRNSWGKSWGDKGYFYLPYAYLGSSKLASDQWVIRTVEV